MDINFVDTIEADETATEQNKPPRFEKLQQPEKPSRLNPAVAMTVALLATMMLICKVKEGNIVQTMQQVQVNQMDHRALLLAHTNGEETAKSTLIQLRLQSLTVPLEHQAAYQTQIPVYEALVKELAEKKEAIKTLADKDQTRYVSLNFRDDQLDLSGVLLTIAISVLAVAALTQFWWLFAFSLVPASFGVVMGLAGLGGWRIYPDALIKLLS